ncbi:amino acid-binding protein [Microlunatus endophyticus]|uniref:Amino acid-binding protein n=1 Tax=Microlunatus endophyticus TaxID=1716077 RepID=A0A917SIY6_9ACTN|nr:ACT domain-containing protein [Microlunatus endophyticus]GGL80663.1 amino acid-binding protein [Microlunatus endophyticus]
MTTLAITVISADRPGIIARVAGALSGLRMNLTDSSMTVLSGQLAMTLICAGETPIGAVRDALGEAAGDDLIIHVLPVGAQVVPTVPSASYLLTVHGADRLGIVSGLTTVVSEAGGNITDLTTRLAGGLYVLAAEIDLPADADVTALRDHLTVTAAALGVEAELQPLERDEL